MTNRSEMRILGSLNGCRLWIELDGHDEQRDHQFQLAQAIIVAHVQDLGCLLTFTEEPSKKPPDDEPDGRMKS